jgi:hypothetical protein
MHLPLLPHSCCRIRAADLNKLLLGGKVDRAQQQWAAANDLWEWECDGLEEFLKRRHVASSAKDVEWVRPPKKQHWCYKDTVKAWGNESWRATWYVAVALIVEVPAYGTGVRAAV